MNLSMSSSLRALAASLLLLAAAAQAAEPPDRVFVNARVWTGDAAQPAAEAFALRGDRILAVGSSESVRALAGKTTVVTDLGGRRVVPGFNDAHWHLPARRSARLDNCGSVEEVQRRLLAYAKSHPADAWLMGRGWTPADFPDNAAHKRYLDAVFPDRPVLIRDRDGHQALANSRALALAGVTRATPDPEDGRIDRDAAGEPTGLLKEAAARLVSQLLPEVTAEETYAILMEEMDSASSFGLTSLQDASEGGLTDNERGAVMRALAEGKLRVRYRAAVPFEKDPTPAQLASYRALDDSVRGTLVSYGVAKVMLDGTVDARTAAMLEPYEGFAERGLAMWTPDDLKATVAAYDKAGLQVQVHAIGDAAVRMTLDAFENAAAVNGPRDRRHRIEHIEVPSISDLPRFRKLGVIASTQPIFALPDANTLQNYAPLLGPARASHSNAFKLFDVAGAVQAFGSDYPVYPMDPLLGIYTAATRQTPQGRPPGGWYPENRISVEAALRHYTRDAAYASFEEQDKGTLSAGSLADFVVLSEDILALAPEQLLKAKVLLTVMGGRETHRAQDFMP